MHSSNLDFHLAHSAVSEAGLVNTLNEILCNTKHLQDMLGMIDSNAPLSYMLEKSIFKTGKLLVQY